MKGNAMEFGYDEGAADRIKEHVDRIAEQHSKEMFSKKQLLDLLDEIDQKNSNCLKWDSHMRQRIIATDMIRQRLLKNEL